MDFTQHPVIAKIKKAFENTYDLNGYGFLGCCQEILDNKTTKLTITFYAQHGSDKDEFCDGIHIVNVIEHLKSALDFIDWLNTKELYFEPCRDNVPLASKKKGKDEKVVPTWPVINSKKVINLVMINSLLPTGFEDSLSRKKEGQMDDAVTYWTRHIDKDRKYILNFPRKPTACDREERKTSTGSGVVSLTLDFFRSWLYQPNPPNDSLPQDTESMTNDLVDKLIPINLTAEERQRNGFFNLIYFINYCQKISTIQWIASVENEKVLNLAIRGIPRLDAWTLSYLCHSGMATGSGKPADIYLRALYENVELTNNGSSSVQKEDTLLGEDILKQHDGVISSPDDILKRPITDYAEVNPGEHLTSLEDLPHFNLMLVIKLNFDVISEFKKFNLNPEIEKKLSSSIGKKRKLSDIYGTEEEMEAGGPERKCVKMFAGTDFACLND